MTGALNGKTIAILATDGVEQRELSEARSALDDAGAETRLIAPRHGLIRAWNQDQYGGNFVADAELKNARPGDYEALLLPGGVMNTDKLRMLPIAVDFVRAFFDAGKPVAAICHGQQLLIDADIVRGKKVTSFPSLRTDLTNAGAEWLDEPVVVDRGIITARRLEDLPAFTARLIQELAGNASPSGQTPSGETKAIEPEHHYA
jgi:protease I